MAISVGNISPLSSQMRVARSIVQWTKNSVTRIVDSQPASADLSIAIGVVVESVSGTFAGLIGTLAVYLTTECARFTNAFQKIEIRKKQLRTAPDVSWRRNLREIDLSSNLLVRGPDVRQNHLLECLKLGGNQLTQAPDVTENPKLRKLYLDSNLLTEPPDVRKNLKLTELSLSNNSQITRAPNVSQNLELRKLDLSLTDILDSPDVTHNQFLRELFLQNTPLRQAPNVRQNEGLTWLALNNVHLPQPPDLSQNRELTVLYLAGCHLTESPDLSRNRQLNIVELSHNQLTNLHDSIFSLPNCSMVYLDGNRFSDAYRQEIQERLAAQSLLGPTPTFHMSVYDNAAATVANHSLEEELNFWGAKFSSPIDVAPLTSLDGSNRFVLLNYLNKLKHTADYKNLKAQKNIVLRVENMVRLACQNSEFREKLIGLMREGSETCGDRVILLFNDIETQWQVFHKEHTLQELADLAVRIERYELLKSHAKKEAEGRRLRDDVETVLYYQIKLKNELNLPITTEGMLYPSMSGVTQEMVGSAAQKIGSISKLDLLATSEIWRSHLKQSNKEAFEELETSFSDQLENLPSDLKSEDYRASCDRIRDARAAAFSDLTKQLTVGLFGELQWQIQ